MAGLGVEKLEKLMPEIVATASKVDIAPHVRDGYIMMFNYLPITFGDKFTPYVGPIIPCILKVGTHHHAEAKKKENERAGCGCFPRVARSACSWGLSLVLQGALFSFGLSAQDKVSLTDPPFMCPGSGR